MNIQEPITDLLQRARRGDEEARARLWQALLPLLKERAGWLLKGNNVAGFVSTSDVLQGAIEQLLRREQEAVGFQDRKHLMAFAVTAMRHIIIDLARKHLRKDRTIVPVDEKLGLKINDDVSWVEVNELLEQLAARDPVKAKVVELRAFAGFTNEEIAAELEISVARVKRHLTVARAFIMGRLGGTPPRR